MQQRKKTFCEKLVKQKQWRTINKSKNNENGGIIQKIKKTSENKMELVIWIRSKNNNRKKRRRKKNQIFFVTEFFKSFL